MLLGANTSRTYYSQSLLPGASNPDENRAAATSRTPSSTPQGPSSRTRKLPDAGAPRVYDHDLVRTDSRAQTLDTFLQPVTVDDLATAGEKRSAQMAALSASLEEEEEQGDDWDPIRMRPRKRSKTTTQAPPQSKEPSPPPTRPTPASHGSSSQAESQVESRGSPDRVSLARDRLPGTAWPYSDTQLSSVKELRADVLEQGHPGIVVCFCLLFRFSLR